MKQMDINFDTTDNREQEKAMEQTENTGTQTFNAPPQPEQLTDARASVDTGLRILFEEMQHAFITRSRKDIAIELKKMENRTSLLQDKINTLHNEVDRLAAIDLDTEFKRMQSTLTHIVQAVNTINNSFGHTLSGMGANVGDGLNITNETVKLYGDETTRQIARLEEETKTNVLFLEHKIQALTDQNNQLRNRMRNSNIILIIGLLLLIGGIAYMIAYQAGVRINMH